MVFALWRFGTSEVPLRLFRSFRHMRLHLLFCQTRSDPVALALHSGAALVALGEHQNRPDENGQHKAGASNTAGLRNKNIALSLRGVGQQPEGPLRYSCGDALQPL